MKSNETGLSTHFAEDYKIKEEPKNIKIEIGNSYLLADGSNSTRQVKVVSIRKINDEVIIYFKWRRSTSSGRFLDFLTGGSWAHDQRSLSTFKAQLLSYGQLNEIEIVYNDKPTAPTLEE